MNDIKTIAVLGGGNWGSTLSILLNEKGYNVYLWEYDKDRAHIMKNQRINPGFLEGHKIPDNIYISSFIEEIVENKDLVLFVVPSHALRTTARMCKGIIKDSAIVLSAVKGLENDTFKRMSEIISGETGKECAVLSGPTIAYEVANHIPTACVAASSDENVSEIIQSVFSTSYFRVYRQTDVIGVELGGALKNIIAIAAGICDGLNLGSNSKSALVTRGLSEIKRMGVYMGANAETFAGLSGLGDMITTCFSPHSRNRRFGEMIGKGKSVKDALDSMIQTVEGVYTIESVKKWAEVNNVPMPITQTLYNVLFNNMSVEEGIKKLMLRDYKAED